MKKLMKLKLLQTLYWDYSWDEWREYREDPFEGEVLRKNTILNVVNYAEWNGEVDENYLYIGLTNNGYAAMPFEDYEDIISCKYFKILENNIGG